MPVVEQTILTGDLAHHRNVCQPIWFFLLNVWLGCLAWGRALFKTVGSIAVIAFTKEWHLIVIDAEQATADVRFYRDAAKNSPGRLSGLMRSDPAWAGSITQYKARIEYTTHSANSASSATGGKSEDVPREKTAEGVILRKASYLSPWIYQDWRRDTRIIWHVYCSEFWSTCWRQCQCNKVALSVICGVEMGFCYHRRYLKVSWLFTPRWRYRGIGSLKASVTYYFEATGFTPFHVIRSVSVSRGNCRVQRYVGLCEFMFVVPRRNVSIYKDVVYSIIMQSWRLRVQFGSLIHITETP